MLDKGLGSPQNAKKCVFQDFPPAALSFYADMPTAHKPHLGKCPNNTAGSVLPEGGSVVQIPKTGCLCATTIHNWHSCGNRLELDEKEDYVIVKCGEAMDIHFRIVRKKVSFAMNALSALRQLCRQIRSETLCSMQWLWTQQACSSLVQDHETKSDPCADVAEYLMSESFRTVFRRKVTGNGLTVT